MASARALAPADADQLVDRDGALVIDGVRHGDRFRPAPTALLGYRKS